MQLVRGKMFLLLVVALGLSACATKTKVDSLDSSYQAKSKDCEVHFHNGGKPELAYEVIGKIESHIKRNLFFGGTVTLEDEAYSELREKTCQLGGDAVIIDDSIETSVMEMSHVHVWATVVKFVTK